MTVVLDTNVLIAADGRAQQAPPLCIAACAQALSDATRDTVLLDLGGEILAEYQRNVNRDYPLGVMATFFVELQSNLGVPDRCRQVILNPNADRVYDEFPDDPELAAFDLNDRKFVAVALASAMDPDMKNAVDSDWWDHRVALAANGVHLLFVCEEVVALWEAGV